MADHRPAQPSDWLLQNLDLIDRGRPVLDVASGRGRHALWLASRGFTVHAIDRDEEKLAALMAQARGNNLVLTTAALDLESRTPDLGKERYGTVLVFNYLHRPLFPALIRALQPGGLLLYETFTIGQRERGRPRNPAFLLRDGELQTLVAPLQILRQRAGEVAGALVASVAAQKR